MIFKCLFDSIFLKGNVRSNTRIYLIPKSILLSQAIQRHHSLGQSRLHGPWSPSLYACLFWSSSFCTSFSAYSKAAPGCLLECCLGHSLLGVPMQAYLLLWLQTPLSLTWRETSNNIWAPERERKQSGERCCQLPFTSDLPTRKSAAE